MRSSRAQERIGGVILGLIAALAIAPLPARAAAPPRAPHGTRRPAVSPATTPPGATIPPAATSATARPAPSRADSTMTLQGGAEGTAFHSLTVQGEDRIHLEFDRPELRLDLDPMNAPGLDHGTAADVLERSAPDYTGPLLGQSTADRSPCLARPYLREFASGAVARFRPAVTHVERWKLMVADSRGETVATFEGRGDPPREIVWDGRTRAGALVTPGLTYSYVFEAYDRAGNRRHFVGEGFSVAAYRLETAAGPVLVFSGAALAADRTSRAGAGASPAAPVVLEAASWLDQTTDLRQPFRVIATARSLEQANALATTVTRQLAALTAGDPARLRSGTEVQPDAPEDGTVRIAPAK